MKRNLLVVAALCLSSLFLNAQSWTAQNTNYPVLSTGVSFISAPMPNVAWITSYDGSGSNINYLDFSKTTDGGVNWTPGTVGTDTTYQFSNICAINGTTCWVAMFDQVNQAGGGIWKTTDGGLNWTQQGVGLIYDANSFPDVVYFWDANNGVAIGDPNGGYYEIYTTTNGGTTWTRTPTGNIPLPANATEYGLTGNYSVVGNTIWFATNQGRVYKSVDKGLNWTVSTVLALPGTQNMDVRMMDANNGLASIQISASGLRPANSVRRTTNGGTSWTTQAFTGKFFTRDFGRIPGSGIYMSSGIVFNPAGNAGTSYSLDTGLTWTTIDTIQHSAFGASDIFNVYTGGFVQQDPVTFNLVEGVFKFTPGILSVNNPVNLKADLSTYPNPSTGIVNMNFKAGRNVDVKLSVVNLIGAEVYSQKFPNVTMFTHRFDFSFLPKGIYLLNLEYGSERSTSKLVIQ